MSFSGAVLAGGRSRRMGRDKAFVRHEDRALAGIARSALLDAGAGEVFSVGGDLARLRKLGFVAIPDDDAGQGPLGGLVTALQAAASDWVVVLACDLPWASAATIRELLGYADDGTDAVVPLLAGRPQPTHAVWRRDCRATLRDAYATGERRLTAALEVIRVRRVTVRRPTTLGDVDTEGELAWARSGSAPAPGEEGS
jgi:molybdopterin-guanine dinucleotide biosynthesis protein A